MARVCGNYIRIAVVIKLIRAIVVVGIVVIVGIGVRIAAAEHAHALRGARRDGHDQATPGGGARHASNGGVVVNG